MGVLFGTDGVRGKANQELTPELAYRLGRAGAYVLSRTVEEPRIIVGKDTRISGDMLEAALTAGICSVGVDVIQVGVMPTPAIAYLTRRMGVTAGVVISASHNPVEDNGIKFFGNSGYKLPDETEAEIERIVLNGTDSLPYPTGAAVGRVVRRPEAVEQYIEFLKNSIDTRLEGLKIVVDCANGAAYQVAPRVLADLGAKVVPIFAEPDGVNINRDCGSTHLQNLQKAVMEHGAHLGLAHDGDADRVIAVDEKGEVVDGDQIMVICGLDLKERGRLPGDKVVVTVMSNMGLHLAFRKAGISVLQTAVGDRYVLEEMKRSGAMLGGEQSGHIIFLEHSTTGDGLLTALQLLSTVVKRGKPLSELAAQMARLPQVMVNVPVRDKNRLAENDEMQKAIAEAQARLGERGRVLVRPSGTEPLIRIMAEGPDEKELEEITSGLAAVAKEHLQ
ncbi:phosphoglucosamine mutase [Calderihabitans maritimus]|uniref:Phosphoglucosamine mutase n=1 Tax=Calderihabitans maritimus TaxID=1246530 RepID=A0A1Z5HSQ0_9FIRM|nr:phosphoglucosamine mutase [Calderihabitans maritimus]GAW92552.1 Phosphoglucosamine mutase [Calderihabitans maritimus]